MVIRKLVSTCKYTVQTVMQPAIQASVFLWAGNVKGGEGRGLASTRISSSMRESQEEGTEYSGGQRQVIKLCIFLSFASSGISRLLLAGYPPSLTSTSVVHAPCPSSLELAFTAVIKNSNS